MADIFREVDEEVRKDRAEKLWKKYGIYVIVACVALVLGTAGRVAWQKYDMEQRVEQSTRFVAAARLSNQGDLDAAIASFASLAKDADTGYAVLARFREATAMAANGNVEGAVRTYDTLAADSGLDDVFRQLASLKAAMLLFDTADAGDLSARLAPLAEDGAPWRYSARELQALLKYRGGDFDGARLGFQALLDDVAVPNSMKVRAREMLAAMAARS